MTMKTGTAKEKVYKTLLTHEFMTTEKLIEKTGIPIASLSGCLTDLRRHGLAESSGRVRNLRWKKHPENKPLYPPQPDLVRRKNSVKDKIFIEPSLEMRIDNALKIANDLWSELQDIKLSQSIYERAVVLDGVQLYRVKK